MAKKKLRTTGKAVTSDKPSNGNGRSSLLSGKKKGIIGILFILISIFILLSIISYSRFDKANLETKNLLSQPEDMKNWLGIFGAYISNFFINSTLGVFSTIFPLMLLVWGFSAFKKISFKRIINISNFLLLTGFILSAFFGVLRMHYKVFTGIYELSGSIGDYLGSFLSRLVGGVGSLLLLFALLIIILIVAFDIKLESIIAFLQNLFAGSSSKEVEEPVAEDEESKENLKKIKELAAEKKKKKKLFGKEEAGAATAAELMESEAEKQTRIRIIRKNDLPAKEDVNKIQNEETKKVDLEKTGEITSKEIDREKESELPNQWEEKINYKIPGLDLLEPIPKEDFKVAEERHYWNPIYTYFYFHST